MNYRYPGPSPFNQGQEHVFYGRDTDAENLYNSILLNNCTVLVGKSGVGKTSLLNANLIPRFHQKNNIPSSSDKRHFVVVKLTVGPWFPPTDNQPYKRLNIKIAERAKDQLGHLTEYNFLPFLNESGFSSVGYDLKQYQYDYFLKGRNVVFFIILDQVEELFTYPYEEFKELIDEIKEIQSPNLPESVREEIEKVEQTSPETISNDENSILYTKLHIKFLFSIRVDKLGLLIRFKEAIPQIFSNPFELRPLSKRQAFDAIKLPAEKEGDFISQPFAIVEEAVLKIVDFLHNLPNSDLENSFDDLKIDPISLQLVCQYIELKIAPYDSDRMIQVDEVKNLEEIFGNYYMDILAKLDCEENDLLKVRILIEEKLIYEPDKRRRQVFYDECNVDIKIMTSLVKFKLLREITFGTRKSYYEVAHDWMILPILLAKEVRLLEEARLKEQRIPVVLRSNYEETIEDGEFKLNHAKADYYFELKDYETAISYYSKYIQTLHENETWHDIQLIVFFKRGESYHKTKQYEKSLSDLEHFVINHGEDATARFYIGYNYHMLEKFEDAKDNYEKVLKIDNANLNAYYNLGIVYQELKMLNESLSMFIELTKLSSNDSDVWYNAGVISNKLTYFDQGVTFLKESVRINSNKTEAFSELAYAYTESEKYEDAIKYYYLVYKSNNTNITALNHIRRISQIIGNESEARKAELILISIESSDPKVFYDLAEIEAERGDFPEALKSYNRAILLNPFFYEAHLKRIDINKRLLQSQELIFNLQELVSNGYDDLNILLELGDKFIERRELHKAIFYYDKAFSKNRNNIEFNVEYAKILIQVNDIEKAKIVLNATLDVTPDHIEASTILADLHIEKEEFASARNVIEKAINSSTETDAPQAAIVDLKYKLSSLPSIKESWDRAEKIYNDLQNTIAARKAKNSISTTK